MAQPNRIFLLPIFSLVCLCFSVSPSVSAEWQTLLDEDLSKWEVFIGVPHKSVEIPGRPSSGSEDGTKGEPLGLSDPLNVFSVEMVDGEPVLKITGEIYGGLTSLEEYDSYHLSLQFRWGEKKWPPRLNRKRDSGLLLHCVGKHGAFWNVWMRCLECQIQEGDCGDFIPLAGTGASVPVRTIEGRGRKIYDPKGALEKAGYTTHGPSKEMPNGEWNTIEAYTIGDTAVFVVNGTPNMVLFDTWQHGPNWKGKVPLTRGKIQIQSEAAEIEYRRIKMQPITEFPAELAEYVKKPE